MTTTIDASVIIPCYQAAATIEAQLDAVESQSWTGRWETICVYQPSSDGTRAILDRYAEQVPNLRVVEAAERHHVSYARNTGVAAALGDRLLFCDADDVIRPGWVAALATALARADLVAGAYDTRALNTTPVAESRGELPPIQVWPGYLGHAAGGNLGVRRELFERIGGFSEGPPALEDTDFMFRAQLDGGATIVAVPDAVIEYRFRERFSEIAAQARSYAGAEVWLRLRYEPRGMPPMTVLQVVRGWVALVVFAPTLIRAHRRPAYAWRLGYGVGRFRAMRRLGYRPRLRSPD